MVPYVAEFLDWSLEVAEVLVYRSEEEDDNIGLKVN